MTKASQTVNHWTNPQVKSRSFLKTYWRVTMRPFFTKRPIHHRTRRRPGLPRMLFHCTRPSIEAHTKTCLVRKPRLEGYKTFSCVWEIWKLKKNMLFGGIFAPRLFSEPSTVVTFFSLSMIVQQRINQSVLGVEKETSSHQSDLFARASKLSPLFYAESLETIQWCWCQSILLTWQKPVTKVQVQWCFMSHGTMAASIS